MKVFQNEIFQNGNFSDLRFFKRRFLLLTWATIKLEEAARNPPKDAVGTRRASPKFLFTSVNYALQWVYRNAAATDKEFKMTDVTVRVEDDSEDCAMYITTDASQRRTILANAHAAWLAATPKKDKAKDDALETALRAAGAIAETDQLFDVYQDSTTTLCIRIDVLDADDFDVIELDAYGNTLRGQE